VIIWICTCLRRWFWDAQGGARRKSFDLCRHDHRLREHRCRRSCRLGGPTTTSPSRSCSTSRKSQTRTLKSRRVCLSVRRCRLSDLMTCFVTVLSVQSREVVLGYLPCSITWRHLGDFLRRERWRARDNDGSHRRREAAANQQPGPV